MIPVGISPANPSAHPLALGPDYQDQRPFFRKMQDALHRIPEHLVIGSRAHARARPA